MNTPRPAPQELRQNLKAFLDQEITQGPAPHVHQGQDSNPQLQQALEQALDPDSPTYDPGLAQEAQSLQSIAQALRQAQRSHPPQALDRTLQALDQAIHQNTPKTIPNTIPEPNDLPRDQVQPNPMITEAKRRPAPQAWFRRPATLAAASILVLATLVAIGPGRLLATSDSTFTAAPEIALRNQIVDPAATAATPGAPAEDTVSRSPSGTASPFAASSTETALGESAPDPAVPSSPPDGDPQANIPTDDRQIIRTADLSLRVPEVKTALESATSTANALGGFVASSFVVGEGPATSASITLRIPADRFDQAITNLQTLGETLSLSTNAQDVTIQVADTDARLKTLRAEEQQLRALLAQARNVREILEVRRTLAQTRQDIEALEAVLKSLRSQAALSTITANFVQPSRLAPPQPRDWLSEAWTRATNTLLAVGKLLAEILVYALVFSPVWIAALAIGWYLRRKRKA